MGSLCLSSVVVVVVGLLAADADVETAADHDTGRDQGPQQQPHHCPTPPTTIVILSRSKKRSYYLKKKKK